jgi:hypothetical protein
MSARVSAPGIGFEVAASGNRGCESRLEGEGQLPRMGAPVFAHLLSPSAACALIGTHMHVLRPRHGLIHVASPLLQSGERPAAPACRDIGRPRRAWSSGSPSLGGAGEEKEPLAAAHSTKATRPPSSMGRHAWSPAADPPSFTRCAVRPSGKATMAVGRFPQSLGRPRDTRCRPSFWRRHPREDARGGDADRFKADGAKVLRFHNQSARCSMNARHCDDLRPETLAEFGDEKIAAPRAGIFAARRAETFAVNRPQSFQFGAPS